MVDPTRFELMERKHGTYRSRAVWAAWSDAPKSNMGKFEYHPSPSAGESMASDDTRTFVTGSATTSAALGQYPLLERLGEGGMGEVWLAQQPVPVQRRVALKGIKAGMDPARVVARFEAEPQTLTLMDHPTIGKVFDAGTTPEGRPFFAMEYVRGESITAYADRARLPVRRRQTGRGRR